MDQDSLEDDISEKAQQAWQTKRFTTKQLTEEDKELACFEYQNTNTERLTMVKAVAHDAIAYYKLTYNDRKTHTCTRLLLSFARQQTGKHKLQRELVTTSAEHE